MRTSTVRSAHLGVAVVLSVGATLAAAPGVASAAPLRSPAAIVLPAPFPAPGSTPSAPGPIFPRRSPSEETLYYPNHFYSAATCRARGRAITDRRSSQYIPGAIAFRCVKRPGDTKWSMYILWR